MWPRVAMLSLLCACTASTDVGAKSGQSGEPPVVPVGLDAYRMWERMPYLRIGTRAYMRSTHDRAGGNEGADASHFLRQEADDFHVTLEVEGSGVLYFVRTNFWHGSPWHYVVDGTDHVVEESSTANPLAPVAGSTFLPAAAFPNPLTWTWADTRGADLNWVPMAFERSLTLAYSRTHYGTGYYIYHLFPRDASNLSMPPTSYDPAVLPAGDVLDLLRRAGEDIAPRGDGVRVHEGSVTVPTSGAVTLLRLDDGPAMVRALKIDLPRQHAIALSRVRLRVTWDGRAHPSVDAPLALFFGTGSLYNRNDAEWLVRALLANVRFDGDRVQLAFYAPMPYFESAHFELVGDGAAVEQVGFHVRTQPYDGPRNHVGYFHATHVDHGEPAPGRDLVLLDTRVTEGGGEYCGNFVGTSWIFSERADLTTLEGDPRFFFDDSDSPQAQGTGTEEWGGGGNYWGGETMTLPLAGHPVGAPSPELAQDEEDMVESAYRFLVADLMPFGRNARIQLEHGGTNESTEHYHTVTYWYGAPGACLLQTDSLDVGDEADERRHDYVSPDASDVVTLSSRHDLGIDSLGSSELHPATLERGRHTRGTSEFTLAIDPENLGVLLRRKLDYAFADQRAEVYVGPAEDGAELSLAGIWYLAGSTTSLYSFPPDELGAPQQVVQRTERRFRDDELLVPRRLTEGLEAIRVRIRFTPVDKPLYPGAELPESAWSELRYSAYVWKLPATE